MLENKAQMLEPHANAEGTLEILGLGDEGP